MGGPVKVLWVINWVGSFLYSKRVKKKYHKNVDHSVLEMLTAFKAEPESLGAYIF